MNLLDSIVRAVRLASRLTPQEIASDIDERGRFVGEVNWRLSELGHDTIVHDVIIRKLLSDAE